MARRTASARLGSSMTKERPRRDSLFFFSVHQLQALAIVLDKVKGGSAFSKDRSGDRV